MKTGTKQAEMPYATNKSLKEYKLLGDFPQDSPEIETYASMLLADSRLRAFSEPYFVLALQNSQGKELDVKA